MSSLQDTPRSERLHIGLFGKRNSGKSALLNALTNQEVAVVSSVAVQLPIRYINPWNSME